MVHLAAVSRGKGVLRAAVTGQGRCELEQVRVTVEPDEFEVEVVYVQPRNTTGEANVIDFEAFARVVDTHGDAVSRTFALHLRRWGVRAGAVRPE